MLSRSVQWCCAARLGLNIMLRITAISASILIAMPTLTSPIRRYADLIVHRALIAARDLGDNVLTENEMLHLQIQGRYFWRYQIRSICTPVRDQYQRLCPGVQPGPGLLSLCRRAPVDDRRARQRKFTLSDRVTVRLLEATQSLAPYASRCPRKVRASIRHLFVAATSAHLRHLALGATIQEIT